MLYLRITFHLVKFVFRHQQNVVPILKSFWFRNKKMRISVSALLMLEKEGDYVLVKNHHRPEYYGPIGGVFKHSSQLPKVLSDMDWQSDYTRRKEKLEDMRRDLRGIVNSFRLADFLSWFDSRKEREGEQAIIRELNEELLEGGVGSSWRHESARITFQLNRCVWEGPNGIQKQPYACQFRYFEIYTIDPTCEVGQRVVRTLFDRASRKENNLVLVTKDEILRGRVDSCESLITGPACYYFSSEWHGREPSPY